MRLGSLLMVSSLAVCAVGPGTVLAQTLPQNGATTQPSTRPAANKIMLNFKDASIDTVLDYLSENAGFIVIKEGSITGRISVMSKQAVTPEEAVALLNTVLKSNTTPLTAIQMGRILKVVSVDTAKKSNIPVRYGSDPNQIQLTDELITQVIPLRSVDAVRLKTDLTPLVGTTADLTANASSNAIIITDTSANIRRVVEIVSNLDKRDALENSILVKQLQYADATSAAKLIMEIFKSDEGGAGQQQGGGNQFFRQMQQQFGGGRGGGGQGGQGGGQQEQGGATRAGKVTASADARTNTIVVTGPSDTLALVDSVIKQLDANPASEQAFFLYPLKNGQSAKISATLNSLFGSSSSVSSTSRTQTRTTGAGASATSTRGGRTTNAGVTQAGGGFGATAGTTTGNMINRGGTTGFGGGATSGLGNANSELAGQVYVVADEDTNSLLIATASRYEKQVRAIIDQLDRAVPQVLIKVLIAEVSHTNTDDLGLDFSVLNIRDSGNGTRGGTDFGAAAAAGGLKISVLEENFTATLRALSTQGKLDVLSRPYILASDNQQATITVGQEVPFITNSRITDTGGTINTVQYQDIGIILTVTPHINPDGLVILDVAPEISSQTGQTVPIQAGVDAPVFAKRSADSRVGIPNGQTIVIGGMMEDRKTSTIQKIPLLGDLPYVGAAFRRTVVTKAKTELLIFLTPHVAQQPPHLRGMSQDEVKGLKLTPNAVQPGTLQEHMKGLQRGKTSQDPDTDLDIPQTETPQRRRIGEPALPGTDPKNPQK